MGLKPNGPKIKNHMFYGLSHPDNPMIILNGEILNAFLLISKTIQKSSCLPILFHITLLIE